MSIPPNRDMAIFHGVLQLSVPEQPRGLRMPIDAFLRSLADDQGENAIGIILSGTGTDGTLGLRAILGAGGVSLVQDPATAKYAGMPVSAIQAGYATHVLSVEKMPKVLLAGIHTLAVRQETPPAPAAVSGMNRILMLLRSGTGHDFSSYKKSTIGRRIERRMSQHNIKDTETYARYLKENPAEVKLLYEELQSTNEELQSTNEELETSKEELQSVNEELITVNAELQSKIEQLFRMQSDMKNLIDNINGGTIFLDEHLKIKRFIREAAQIYRLVASDLGQPLCDIKSNIQDENLLAEAQAVLDSLTPQEHEMRTVGGAWYLARIQPYRTLENVIDGVVLTFTDISKRVAAEAAEKLALKLAEGIVDTVREPLIVLDENLKIISASRSFYRDFQTTPEDTVGRPIYSLGNQQWDIPKLRELLENILPHNQSFEGYEVEHDFPAIGHRRILLNGRRIVDNTGDTKMILLAMEKIP